MAQFSSIQAKLAFQVDRRIMDLEDADYMRMDLSAHEKILFPSMKTKKPFTAWKSFAVSALGIYLLLFSITNAPAYAKIVMANIQQIWTSQNQEELALLSQGGRAIQERDTLQVWESGNSEMAITGVTLTPSTYENRLRIPALGVNAPIIEPSLGLDALESKDWNALEEQVRDSLSQGIVHYPGTAAPGKIGNAFLTGHSSNVFWEKSEYNTIFALLPRLELGADIYVTYGQNEYHYRVIGKKEVPPSDVSILNQGNQKILTLMTCTPVGTAIRRLVLTAELVEE